MRRERLSAWGSQHGIGVRPIETLSMRTVSAAIAAGFKIAMKGSNRPLSAKEAIEKAKLGCALEVIDDRW